MSENEDEKKLTSRMYLDKTVVPVILQALTEVAKQRPPNPIEFVANYLMERKDTYKPEKKEE